jgi:hypothetical protein
MKTYIILFFLLFFYSCSTSPLSKEDQEAAERFNGQQFVEPPGSFR